MAYTQAIKWQCGVCAALAAGQSRLCVRRYCHGLRYFLFKLGKIVATDERLPCTFANGSKRHPEVGAMLIWSEGGEFQRTGHVAIITEVFADKLRVAEQNVDFLVEGRITAANYPPASAPMATTDSMLFLMPQF